MYRTTNFVFGVAAGLTAFDEKAIGAKVHDSKAFLAALDRVLLQQGTDDSGAALCSMPDSTFDLVSADVGLRSKNEDHYIKVKHQGHERFCLKHEHARARRRSLVVTLCTREAYMQSHPGEDFDEEVTHVILVIGAAPLGMPWAYTQLEAWNSCPWVSQELPKADVLSDSSAAAAQQYYTISWPVADEGAGIE